MNKIKKNRLAKFRASIVKRFNIFFRGGYTVETAYDRKFLIDWNHPVDKKIAFQMFEHDRLTHFVATAESVNANTFLDIGAHAGLYSILINAKLPHAEIHAFEPDSTNGGQLHANLFLNRLANSVTVHPIGLSDREDVLRFAASNEHEHRAFSKISDQGSITIVVKPLDHVLTLEGRIIAMKIDVEGHEVEVLQGAKSILSKNSCYMQIESSAEKFDLVKSFLLDLGYRWLGSDGDHYFTNIPSLKN